MLKFKFNKLKVLLGTSIFTTSLFAASFLITPLALAEDNIVIPDFIDGIKVTQILEY